MSKTTAPVEVKTVAELSAICARKGMEREVARLEQMLERRRARVTDAERKLAQARKRLERGTPVKSTRHGAAKRKRAAASGGDHA